MKRTVLVRLEYSLFGEKVLKFMHFLILVQTYKAVFLEVLILFSYFYIVMEENSEVLIKYQKLALEYSKASITIITKPC